MFTFSNYIAYTVHVQDYHLYIDKVHVCHKGNLLFPIFLLKCVPSLPKLVHLCLIHLL